MEIPDMQHQVMGYDRSATMFSPDGHLLQVEYAEKTVRLGTASIGMNCADGVVIVADKGKKDSLIVSESADKIYEVDEHLITSAAGIISDARILVNHLRVFAQQHRVTYDSPVDVESTIREVSDVQQQYTQNPGVRPFGIALIVGGVSNGSSKLYTSDIKKFFKQPSLCVLEELYLRYYDSIKKDGKRWFLSPIELLFSQEGLRKKL